MLVMVTFVGLLIFIFSLGYMSHDENFSRFFCFLSLFASAMLGLLVANSLLLLFIFWEIVGLLVDGICGPGVHGSGGESDLGRGSELSGGRATP
jgi:NADH:ubiquinone oxidoreductase subunit 2 (subunit N)